MTSLRGCFQRSAPRAWTLRAGARQPCPAVSDNRSLCGLGLGDTSREKVCRDNFRAYRPPSHRQLSLCSFLPQLQLIFLGTLQPRALSVGYSFQLSKLGKQYPTHNPTLLNAMATFPPPPVNTIDWSNVGFRVREGVLRLLPYLLSPAPQFLPLLTSRGARPRNSQWPYRITLLGQNWPMESSHLRRRPVHAHPRDGARAQLRPASI